MNAQDRVNLDFYLKVHEQAASKIDNLQTALFTTITGVIASGIIGMLVGFKDFSTLLSQVLQYPWILVTMGILWGIAVFLISAAGYVFIECIIYGFKIVQIEDDFLEKPIPHGEIGNFIPNNEANFLEIVSTRFYYPGLLASGYCHKFFSPLFILTIILITAISTVQGFLFNFAASPISNTAYYGIHQYLISHNFSLTVFTWLFFLIFCLVIVPIFIPNRRVIADDIQHKKIVLISETLSHLHGTEVSVMGFAHNAVQMAKSILVVGPIESGGETIKEKCRQNKIPLVQLPSMRTWFLGQPDFRLADPLLLRLIISNKTEYIFINAFPGPLGLVGLLIGRLKRKKVIFYYHVYLPKFSECLPLIGRTRFVKGFFRYITRKFSNMCDMVVVPSKAVLNEMIEWGVEEPKIKVVPIGIDPFFIELPPCEEIIEIKNGHPSPLILYVGRLSQEKNIELLVHTFDRVLEKYPSAGLVIVGKGPEEQKIKKLVRKLELENFVEFKGFLDWQKLKPLYWAADVFCMPSLGETQGLTILEAKACQRPCVVLNKVGAGEQIENGIDGLLVDERENAGKTAFAFSLAIDKILCDKDFSERIAKEARARAIRKTMGLSTKELIRLFERIPDRFIKTPNSNIITTMGSFISFVTTNICYFREAYFKSPNPKMDFAGLRADLHAHPYINNTKDLINTLDVMIENNVPMLAITVHGMGNSREKDFWSVKEMIVSEYDSVDIKDMGIILQMGYKKRQLYLMPAYEDYCILDGLKGRLDIVIVAPEKDFLSEIAGKEDFESKVKIARKYNGIVIAAHPYTIWDPYGPKGFIKFRLASPSERRLIRSEVFPKVDCVDLVATNCAWMMKSNELLRNEYPKKPICSSDTHAVNRWVRKEIGKSGCVFSDGIRDMRDGTSIRAFLKQQIISEKFETYLSYICPIKFIISVAVPSPTSKHP